MTGGLVGRPFRLCQQHSTRPVCGCLQPLTIYMKMRNVLGIRRRSEGREIHGGQSQDGWRATMGHPHQGRPNLGQPESPLTAVDPTASLPSRLSGVRYNPCTCSPVEAVCHQTREEICLVLSKLVCIELPPFQRGDGDVLFSKISVNHSILTRIHLSSVAPATFTYHLLFPAR